MASALIVLAPGCEELEAVTLIDILRRGDVELTSAGLAPGPVTASRNTVLLPDTLLDEVLNRSFDALILPGGEPGATHLQNDRRVIDLMQRMAAADKYVAAICAAPRVLALAGLLDGRRATCFPGAIDPKTYPRIRLENRAVIIDGNIATSRGPGTALDFALELVRVLQGKAKRDAVEAQLVRPPDQALAQIADWG